MTAVIGQKVWQLNRTVQVTIANVTPGSFFATQPNALVFTGQRVAFEIEKSVSKTPNRCSVSIDNLSPTTLAFLQQRPLQLQLLAGYDNENQRVFVGDVRYVYTDNSTATPTTKIECGDGAQAFKAAQLVRGYKAGTDPRQVLKDLAASMNLVVPSSVLAMTFPALASGMSVSGPSVAAIDALCRANGLEWSIQNGVLQILVEGEPTANQALAISQDTGMIGSPEHGNPPAKGGPPILKVKHELLAAASPGGLLQVTSKNVNGVFRIEKARHNADTHGETWETEMDCTPR